jgi:general secretion pathway protein G
VLAHIRKIRKDDSGFTLIELLMVIVILGVLATIVVFSVQGITDTGEEAACKADLKTVETAVEAYYAQNNGDYPDAMGDLVPSFLHSLPTSGVTIGNDTGVVTAPCGGC